MPKTVDLLIVQEMGDRTTTISKGKLSRFLFNVESGHLELELEEAEIIEITSGIGEFVRGDHGLEKGK